MILKKIIDFYKTGPDRPLISRDEAVIRKIYERKRWSVFLTVTFGYGLFYVCKLSLSVVKRPMIEEGILNADQLGDIGAALLFTYAFGKLTNGFLADRSNIKRFMSTGLFVSAIINLLMGFNTLFWLFLILWGINGWFQSMGSAPSVVAITHWFSNKERGTRYGIWSIGHNIGEGLTLVGTAIIVESFGWRWGFWFSGLLCIVVATIMYFTLADRPQTYGLPPVSEYKKDYSSVPKKEGTITEKQLLVLKNPYIWILGLSSACMYVARYAINNWGILYLQEEKGYSLSEAGSVIAFYPIMGAVGAILSGIVSDRFFNSRRNIPCLICGILEITSLILFYIIPPGNKLLDTMVMALFGLSLGALLVYLGGLMAVDIASRKAAGAAMGLVGILSYIGASVQDKVSGYLLEKNKIVIEGKVTHDFSDAFYFWIGASILSCILALTVWKAKPEEG